MLSHTANQAHIPRSLPPIFHLNYAPVRVSSLIFVPRGKKRIRVCGGAGGLTRPFGSLWVKYLEGNREGCWFCKCKGSEGDEGLESEMMEFMAKSDKPNMFPTKRELVAAGRMDLVETIKKRGGWFSLGWDDDGDDENVENEERQEIDFDIREFQRRVESCKETGSLGRNYVNSFCGNFRTDNGYGFSSGVDSFSENSDSWQLAVREIGAEQDTGVEGILSRLEKQRNTDFGIDSEKNRFGTRASSKDARNETQFRTFVDVDRADPVKSSRLVSIFPKEGPLKNPGSWRTWSNQRAGFQQTEFEAAEIVFKENRAERYQEASDNEISQSKAAKALDRSEEINHNLIHMRLQNLQAELSMALQSLRSKKEDISQEDAGSFAGDIQDLYDAWEFQENEVMSAQERLRSLRAKLAVLEGKMALAIIDAQKIAEEKQKRINHACAALKLLRTTYIVWPNSASEVLLAGSFDGWTSQRKMKKSRTGIFSMCLKLYPGRYEIKFIVDGVWKIDPLRPIVNSSGYENNLLIIM